MLFIAGEPADIWQKHQDYAEEDAMLHKSMRLKRFGVVCDNDSVGKEPFVGVGAGF